MQCIVVNELLRKSVVYKVSEGTTLSSLAIEDFYVVCQGKIQNPNAAIQNGQIYRLVPRLVGGKGGFGSMLRAIGAQIEKTTNHEACRDLSGRRMRDVNNEKKLKDWVAKAADREKEKAEKRRERMERRKAVPKHMFHDPQYQEQKSKVLDNLDDALRQGLQKSATGSTTKRKGTATSTSAAPSKKAKAEWMGIDVVDDLSDSADDKDSAAGSDEATPMEDEEQPCCSTTTGPRSTQEDEVDNTGSTNSDSPTPLRKDSKDLSIVNGNAEKDMNCRNGNEMTNGEDEKMITSTTDSPDGDGLLATLAKTPPKESRTQEENSEQKESEVDLNAFTSAKELETVGLENLKCALVSRGMKCGGTLQERAARLFSVKGLTPDQIDPSLKSKGGKVKKSKPKQ